MNLMLEMLMKSSIGTAGRELSSLDLAYAYDKIPDVLQVLCQRCNCERSYIHEVDKNGLILDSYEYHVDESHHRKLFTEEEISSVLSSHMRELDENSYFILEDVENLKSSSPRIYSILKLYKIENCIHVPVYVDDKLYGYLALENFSSPDFYGFLNFVLDAAKFFSNLLHQKKMLEEYRYLAFHDQMTGAWNRYAYEEEIKNVPYYSSLGLIYYNMSFLTRESEDDLSESVSFVKDFYKEIQFIFKNHKIFRLSCDEFVVFCLNIDISNFKFLLFIADKSLKNENVMIYGSSYSRSLVDFNKLLSEAKSELYKMAKNNRVTKNDMKEFCPNMLRCSNGCENVLGINCVNDFLCKIYYSGDNAFAKFINDNYFDIEFFFNSMSLTDNYPYFGDLNTNLFYICDKMKELFGFNSNIIEDLIEKWKERIPASSDVELYEKDLQQVLARKKSQHNLIYKVLDVYGNEMWVECSGVVKFDPEVEKPTFFSGFVRKLEYNFIIDPVSGLAREGNAIIKIKELKDAKKDAVFIGFKLNNFDDINSSNGREVGNNLIADTIKRLIEHFKDEVLFYRLDGLRFLGIIMSDVDSEEVVDGVYSIVQEMYNYYNIIVTKPCCIGMINKDIESQTAPEIISNIMNVIELAKNNPEHKYFSYSVSDVTLKRQRSQMAMTLCKNVAEGFQNFRVVIQPVILASDMVVHSGELLLRWNYEGKDISPAIFVPILEKSNLIVNVGKWVFEEAVKNVRRVSQIIPDFKINFNVSYNQIKDDKFVDDMRAFLKHTNVEAQQLVMELTETHYNEDPNKLLNFVKSCKMMGMKVALDDFGSGYSSMELLLKYPSDIVKLDKSLIKEISDSEDNREFINSIVYACHQFKKNVCIEGVETRAELDFALNIGCDMIQGYYFYKPMELEEFYNRLVIENGLVKLK